MLSKHAVAHAVAHGCGVLGVSVATYHSYFGYIPCLPYDQDVAGDKWAELKKCTDSKQRCGGT